MSGGTAASKPGSNDLQQILKQYQSASPGMGASNPQASPMVGSSMAPWMQALQGSSMGANMLQAARPPQAPPPQMAMRPQMGAQAFNPAANPGAMQQQQQPQLTPQMMNLLLAKQTGLLGGGGGGRF